MKEQLIRYIDLLFAGAPQAADIKQEILQNTLERYDDLVAQGKSPQAAYQLAISGIGDISELLGCEPPVPSSQQTFSASRTWKKAMRAIAICLYILSPLPLFILQDEIGLCGLLGICAVATALIMIGSESKTPEPAEVKTSPRSQLRKAISAVVWAVGLCIYFLLSFISGAWYITWIIFLILGAVEGLIKACIDLKEAQ